jgi:pimeloyl-ACP methyl ester carboxylesterase
MRRGWKLFLLGWALVLGGGYLAHRIQTGGGVRVADVRFTGTAGLPMSGLLYIPRDATPDHPAPGILAVHGYINSRETQSGFAIALARAGYVVLALDQTGHGYSGGVVGQNGFGGPDGLRYLRGLDVVDPANIGLEGHSMGGWAVLSAAAAMPDAYKAVVLEGSGTGIFGTRAGTPDFPRNVAVVFSRYDEFSNLMWGVARGADVGKSAKLKTLFDTAGDVEAGALYGDIADGSARRLYTPATTHPGDHISPSAIADAVDWFGRTLQGGKPASDSHWLWKEIGTGIAFAGMVLLMLGAFDLYLRLPLFSDLPQTPEPARRQRSAGWWLLAAGFALIPVIDFYPFLALGQTILPPSLFFPQSITNQILTWAGLNAILTLIAGRMIAGPRMLYNFSSRGAIRIATLTAATGYLALLVSDFLFKTDFRFWVVALKLLSPRQFAWFLAYVIPFTLCMLIFLRALLRLAVRSDGTARQYAAAIAILAGGFLLFLAAQYGPLFLDGALPLPGEALNAIIAIQFLPLMAMVGAIAVFTWRRTNSPLPGAVIAGIVVSWYIVAGTAVQFAAT